MSKLTILGQKKFGSCIISSKFPLISPASFKVSPDLKKKYFTDFLFCLKCSGSESQNLPIWDVNRSHVPKAEWESRKWRSTFGVGSGVGYYQSYSEAKTEVGSCLQRLSKNN